MKLGLILTFNLLFTLPGFADINAQSIAYNCRNCHAPQASETKLTNLEQLSAAEIRTTLLAYKYDKKTATLMPRIAKGYTDAEISAVADFLGKP